MRENPSVALPVALAICAIAFALTGCADRSTTTGCADSDATQVISAEAIRAHMAFLADDALEGRGSGSRGHALAAKYARSQFQVFGLRGGADGGGYLQPVPLRRGEVVPEESAVVLDGPDGGRSLRFEEEFLFFDTQAGTGREVVAPVVFAGYGVTAPEHGYDDYANIDARGKIVALLGNGPATLPDTLRAYHAEDLTKQQNAVAHGAIGILWFSTPDDERRFPWTSMIRETHIGWTSLRWIDDAGRAAGLLATLQVLAGLSRPGAEALFEGEEHSLEEIFTAAENGAPPAFALGKRARIRRASRHTPVESDNVIAVLEGSDPALRDQYVVYTAHIDHLGLGPVIDGDGIYNGAADNAAGTAIVLEIARAFASLPQSPRRSVMFLLVTAEEAGLMGSDYFVQNPTVPLERIVANINLDGGVSLYPAADIIAWGEEHSSLKPIIRKAAAEVGFGVSPDPFPEETIFIRSDQYCFVRKGIPSVFLELGLESLDLKIDGREVVTNWLVTAYHSPKDDMNQSFHFESSARLARVAFRIGREVAMMEGKPEWNEGDFFGGKFGRSAE
jgi:hypothetical protein